jgi:hypothetical protein
MKDFASDIVDSVQLLENMLHTSVMVSDKPDDHMNGMYYHPILFLKLAHWINIDFHPILFLWHTGLILIFCQLSLQIGTIHRIRSFFIHHVETIDI